MPRSSRTTSEQMEVILNFLQQNKIMLSGKTHPKNTEEVNLLWKSITTILNNTRGAKKTVDEWKIFYTQWKSKTRARARTITKDHTATGGGSSQNKSLSDLEERLMGLIGWVTIEGTKDLPDEVDPGINIEAANEENYNSDEPMNLELENEILLLDDISIPPMRAASTLSVPTQATNIPGSTSTEIKTKVRYTSVSPRKRLESKQRRYKTSTSTLEKSAQIYAESSMQISKSLELFADGLCKLASAIEKYAAATEKLATSQTKDQ